MGKGMVVRSAEVLPFTVDETYSSKMLIDKHNSGSERLQLNEGRLKAGCRLSGATHPESYDEIYYVLQGHAVLHLDNDEHEIGPGAVVFIPGGTFHALENASTSEDVVILTVWPQTPEPGANGVYDRRIKEWGTSFRTVAESK